MATNPYFNKVVRGNQTIIDLTADTVTPADVRAGVTFHDLTGAAQVGTAQIGKTVASVAPAAVPSAWNSVSATFEAVVIDYGTAEVRQAVASLGQYRTENTLDAALYALISLSAGSTLASYASGTAQDGNGTFNYAINFAPSGTTPAESVGGWAETVTSGYANDLYYLDFTYDDNGTQRTERVTMPNGCYPSSFYAEEATGGVRYVVVCTDGTEVRSAVHPAAEFGFVWERCACVNVTGTVSATTPGYLVTYSDATSETFQASSGDVADGSY